MVSTQVLVLVLLRVSVNVIYLLKLCVMILLGKMK